jgi:hypothetical protein
MIFFLISQILQHLPSFQILQHKPNHYMLHLHSSPCLLEVQFEGSTRDFLGSLVRTSYRKSHTGVRAPQPHRLHFMIGVHCLNHLISYRFIWRVWRMMAAWLILSCCLPSFLSSWLSLRLRSFQPSSWSDHHGLSWFKYYQCRIFWLTFSLRTTRFLRSRKWWWTLSNLHSCQLRFWANVSRWVHRLPGPVRRGHQNWGRP